VSTQPILWEGCVSVDFRDFGGGGHWVAQEFLCPCGALGVFWAVGVRVEEGSSNLGFEACPVA
jgi:hypothetical protein